MCTMANLEESFIAALRREIDKLGYGAQKQLAEKLSISRQHLNDVLGERKIAGKRLQERIAKEHGFTYENYLAIGRMVLEGKPEEEIEKIASVLRHRPGTHQVTNEFPIGAQGVTEAPITWQHGDALREIDKRFLAALHQLNPRDYSVVLEFIASLAQTSPYPQRDKMGKKAED